MVGDELGGHCQSKFYTACLRLRAGWSFTDRLPNISGAEKEIEGAIAATAGRSVFLADSRIDFGRIKSAFANALHMHQPLISRRAANRGDGQEDMRGRPD